MVSYLLTGTQLISGRARTKAWGLSRYVPHSPTKDGWMDGGREGVGSPLGLQWGVVRVG